MLYVGDGGVSATQSPAAEIVWLFLGETGLSSEAMCAVALGVELPRWHHPHDAADLRRCLAFLEATGRHDVLGEMGTKSPYWAALMPHWYELEKLVGDYQACTERMREIYAPVEANDRSMARLGNVTIRSGR